MRSESARLCTREEAAEFVRLHNAYRCLHGSPPLVWSDAMAENAYNYIKDMTEMEHSSSYSLAPPAGPAGENLYWTSPVSRTPARMVLLWYAEVNFCQGGPEGFMDGCRDQSAGITSHFTVMIWRTARFMGCAWSDNMQLVICRYKGPDELGFDTPNVGFETNFKSHVFRRYRTASQCNATDIDIPPSDVLTNSSAYANVSYACRCVAEGHAGPWEASPCDCLGVLEVTRPCACNDASACSCAGSGQIFLGSPRLAAAADRAS